MTVVDRFVQARAHGGAMRPTLTVIHSAETPLRAGYAASIAENWFATKAETSAHFMVDPVEIVRMLSDNVVAWAVGPRANGFTLNWEQAGYARFSRAEWTTPDGMAQLDRLAAGVRERNDANGIPNRWASDDDIRAAARGVPGGICFHDDIRRVLGGTVHTDPMPHYPRDLLMAAVQDGAGLAPLPIDPRGTEMRVLSVKENGRIYTATDLEVTYVGALDIAATAQAVWGEAKEVSQREVDVLSFDANARRARHRAETVSALASQVTGADVDENALGQTVVAGLLPQLTAAFADKGGLTAEEVEAIVRGVFGDAATTS